MGFLDFNLSEIASRIVRGAAVRGRIRPTLDDGVLPTVRVGDYTRSPFRLDELVYFAVRLSTNSGAGNFSNVWVQNNSKVPVILERYHVFTRGFAVGVIAGFRPTVTTGVSTPFVTMETFGPATPYRLLRAPGVELLDNVTGVLDTPSDPTDRHDLVVAAPSDYTADGCDITIEPGHAFGWAGTVANAAFGVAARIRVAANVQAL